jgi:hypothetical protein
MGVKVLCFDTLLQLLIIKGLHHESGVFHMTAKTERLSLPAVSKSKNASRDTGVTGMPKRVFTQLL